MILAAFTGREDFFSFYFAVRKIFTIFAAENKIEETMRKVMMAMMFVLGLTARAQTTWNYGEHVYTMKGNTGTGTV